MRSRRSGNNANLAPAERMRRVLELLETQPQIWVSELVELFSVSDVTVRNDLRELARQGLVVRVRGGASTPQRSEHELAFEVRLALQAAEKRAIARAAAAMVGDGEAIALDCSTSAYYLALELKGKKELVVVTNGLLIAEALAAAPGVSLLLAGGILRRASMSTIGDLAADFLRDTHINKGFFGARGLSAARGLMDLNPDEVRVKRELAAACEQVIGIFDHTKWARSALLSFVPSERVNAIVTDAAAPPELVEEWRARAVTVVTAEPEPVWRPVPVHPLRRRAPLPEGTAGPVAKDGPL